MTELFDLKTNFLLEKALGVVAEAEAAAPIIL